MARFFAANPNPWGWNPTQYGGLPAQFTYLPSLPYVAGLISRLAPSLEPDYAYRLLASTFACLGPATLFLFVLYFTRSRWWALAAALAYTFFSPSYYLVHTIDVDRGKAYLPWRLQVLVKYGEGTAQRRADADPAGADRRVACGCHARVRAGLSGGRAAGGRRADQLGGGAGAGLLLPADSGHAGRIGWLSREQSARRRRPSATDWPASG